MKNGKVFSQGGLKSIDLWISQGKIAALGGAHRADEEIDARGLIVIPGAVDMHVHFRDPGPNWKEDWESGSTSAAAGGVTTVVDQPNTDPRTLDKKSFELKLDLAKHRSVVDFCINCGPGKVEEMARLGASALGEIFTYEHSDAELEKILEEAKRQKILPTIHAEDATVIKEHTEPLLGEKEAEAYSRARPREAEILAINKALKADRLHICHLSTSEGLDLVRYARGLGKKVSCEATPHHLLLNRHDYRCQGSFLKMNPPLRDPSDNEALWTGLRDGSIDAIASDHAPHLPEEKRDDIWEAPAGVPGVETMLPLMLMAVRRNLISLERAIKAISTRPAEILGLKTKGRIAIGMDADLVLFDPRNASRIRADRLHSRADWTPYEGMEGIFPRMTIIRGETVFEGDLDVKPGQGRFLPGALTQKFLLE